jgi:hypothetical protein
LRTDGAEVQIAVATTDDARSPLDVLYPTETYATLIGPDMLSETVQLEQVAVDRYEGGASVSEPGTYLVQVVQRDAQGAPIAQQTTGLVIPYSPEYKRTGDGQALLNALARTTGGVMLEEPANAFAPTQVPASRATPMGPWLLLVAVLLFPVDVAVRRLRLTASDWARLRGWARERIGVIRGRSPKPAAAPVLSELFEAKARAQRRTDGAYSRAPHASESAVPSAPSATGAQAPVPTMPQASSASSSVAEASDAESEPDPEDVMARLRAARDRARHRR